MEIWIEIFVGDVQPHGPAKWNRIDRVVVDNVQLPALHVVDSDDIRWGERLFFDSPLLYDDAENDSFHGFYASPTAIFYANLIFVCCFVVVKKTKIFVIPAPPYEDVSPILWIPKMNEMVNGDDVFDPLPSSYFVDVVLVI